MTDRSYAGHSASGAPRPWFPGSRRDVAPITFTRPRHYEVPVDDEVADQAARLIASEA